MAFLEVMGVVGWLGDNDGLGFLSCYIENLWMPLKTFFKKMILLFRSFLLALFLASCFRASFLKVFPFLFFYFFIFFSPTGDLWRFFDFFKNFWLLIIISYHSFWINSFIMIHSFPGLALVHLSISTLFFVFCLFSWDACGCAGQYKSVAYIWYYGLNLFLYQRSKP